MKLNKILYKLISILGLLLCSSLPVMADNCKKSLVDFFGGIAVGTTATALVAGESALIIIGTAGAAIVTAPAVATGATVTAIVGSVAYAGRKAWCWATDWFSEKHFLNEKVQFLNEDWNKSGPVYPAGTKLLLLRYMDANEAPSRIDARKNSYAWVINDFGIEGFVESKFLNAIYDEDFTHVFNKDSRVYYTRGVDGVMYTMIPKGHPVKVFKVRKKDGWVKIELANGDNRWLRDIKDLAEISVDFAQ